MFTSHLREKQSLASPIAGDIIIERWVPYGAQAKRRTIVQRAAAAAGYAKPRNVIVVYEAVQARIIRQFQRLGVAAENPQAYLSRYGASLLDAATLVRQARTAGVVEDIVSISSTTPRSYALLLLLKSLVTTVGVGLCFAIQLVG